MATNYPGSLDSTATTLPDNKLDSTLTGSNDHAGHHNNLADAIIAIETALGINPQGSYATVAAALLDKVVLSPTANQTIQGTGDIVGLAVKATAAQNTANVFEMRLNNNAIGAYIDKAGNLSAQAFKIAGTALAASHLSNGVTGTGAIVLASALGTYAPLASPTFTGTPAAPTAAVDTNTTQLATTAFVLAQAASANPVMNGTVAVGTSTRFARADHVHPTDTSLLPLAGGTMTGQLVLASTGVKFNDGTTQTTANTSLVKLAGRINSDGTIAAGTGFTCSKTATGQYTITFNSAFSVIPVITVNAFQGAAEIANGNSAWANPDAISTTSVTIYTGTIGNGSGGFGNAYSNRSFHFTVSVPS